MCIYIYYMYYAPRRPNDYTELQNHAGAPDSARACKKKKKFNFLYFTLPLSRILLCVCRARNYNIFVPSLLLLLLPPSFAVYFYSINFSFRVEFANYNNIRTYVINFSWVVRCKYIYIYI